VVIIPYEVIESYDSTHLPTLTSDVLGGFNFPASAAVAEYENSTATFGLTGDAPVTVGDPIASDDAPADASPHDSPHGSPWSATIAFVSDYRISGVTQTGHAGAPQASIDYDDSASGWSAGVWASTISEYGGSNLEVDFYGAKSFDIGESEVSFGAAVIVLPGGDNAAAALVHASAARPIGPVDVTLAARYAPPDQGNLGDKDDIHISLDGATPIGKAWGAPLTLGASIGFERGAFAVEDKKLDWTVSLTANVAGVDVGLTYADTDIRDKRGAGGLIFSIARTF
jgi:uncharacterized protein (TIGR02001 family)